MFLLRLSDPQIYIHIAPYSPCQLVLAVTITNVELYFCLYHPYFVIILSICEQTQLYDIHIIISTTSNGIFSSIIKDFVYHTFEVSEEGWSWFPLTVFFISSCSVELRQNSPFLITTYTHIHTHTYAYAHTRLHLCVLIRQPLITFSKLRKGFLSRAVI